MDAEPKLDAMSPWVKWLNPQTDAVVVQLVDGKPFVSIMLKTEEARDDLERLAQRVLRGLHATQPAE